MTILFSVMIVGASAIVGFTAAICIAWWLLGRLSRDARYMFDVWSVVHRHFSERSGYEAIALTTPEGRIVVSLESVAWAIDARDLLSLQPVSITPETDAERECDGRA